MSESTSYPTSHGLEASEVQYDEEGRPYVVVKKRVRVRRRKKKDSDLSSDARASVAGGYVSRPLPPIPKEEPDYGDQTYYGSRVSPPPPPAGYNTQQRYPAYSQPTHDYAVPPKRASVPQPTRTVPASPVSDRSPRAPVAASGRASVNQSSYRNQQYAPTQQSAADYSSEHTYPMPSQGPIDKKSKYVYVHTSKPKLSRQEEFERARMKYYSKVKYEELNNNQKIEFLKLKHRNSGNEWMKGGPANEQLEPAHNLDNFCYRYPRPQLGSPKQSLVKDKVFEPVDPPGSVLRDLPEPVISWQPDSAGYNAAYTSLTPQANIKVMPPADDLGRPQMSHHDTPDPKYETSDVLYSNANPVDYEDDFLPVLPANAMSSRDGDCVFVNPPPEGAPKSPKHSLESPNAPEQTSSRRTKPPSINENTSQENDDSNSASIHGIWDQLKDFEVSDLPRYERRKTNTVVVGNEVLNVKSSPGSSSHGSFKKSGYTTPPNSRTSPIKPPKGIPLNYNPYHHMKYLGGTMTPPHIVEARHRTAGEIVDEVLIEANNQFQYEIQKNSMGGYLRE